MGNVKRSHKQDKVVTRNIFPDILKIFKVILIGYLICFVVLGILGEIVPFVRGYSFYTCRESHLEYGFPKGETLVLKNNDKYIKGKYILADTGKFGYDIRPRSKDIGKGVIVYSFNIFKFGKGIYNWIYNAIKGIV